MILSDEEAKAVQEVARTARKYEPDLRELGTFIGRVTGRSGEQFGGLVGDVLAMMRIELALRYKRRVDRIMKERKLHEPTRHAAINIIYPLLQAASLEDDDDIQEMFAQLLVNAIDADSDVTILKSFVDVVRTMSSFEARILVKLVDVPQDYRVEGTSILTGGLPDEYQRYEKNKGFRVPKGTLALALSNLERNGCIKASDMWMFGSSLGCVDVTPFGLALLQACRSPVHRTPTSRDGTDDQEAAN